MSKSLTVSAAEANRSFSKLMRVVEEGTEVTVTSHGKPKLKMVPVVDEQAERERRRAAWDRLRERLKSQEPVVIGPWTRDDLYDRDW